MPTDLPIGHFDRKRDHPTDERIIPPDLWFSREHALHRPVGQPAPGSAAPFAERVTRFLPPGVDERDLLPSFAMLDQPAPQPPATDHPNHAPPTPRFAPTRDGRYHIDIPLEPGTTLHGVGEHAGGLERSGRTYRCWNTDYPGYSTDNPALYQSHPWVFAVRSDGSAFGALLDTPARVEVDLEDPARIVFRADGPPAALYILTADHPAELCERLADLVGRPPMPPRWSLGYQQCRWSYFPAGRVAALARQFRERRIPCDVLWLDIDYMDGFRIFTFHPARFPDPKGLNDRLHGMGFRTAWMIDPAPKAEPGYSVYDEGRAGGHFVLDSRGDVFIGKVWPGDCAFPDFSRPETCDWWASLYKPFMDQGVDAVWNDMNEPAVFETTALTMPDSNWHRGGDGLPAAPHSYYHNVYGMLMVRASRRGILGAKPDHRPFLLTRANFIGGHRYAATWTGDNSATYDDLRWSTPMCLNMGLSGQPFVGPDIGGFVDDSEGDGELFARWMGVGCLLPFARAHVAQGSVDKEPWSFGPEVEDRCRRAIERRYRLLPLLYTLFRHAHRTGIPVVRPAFFADPADPRLRDEDRLFLLGDNLLARIDPADPNAPGNPADPPALPRSAEWRPVAGVHRLDDPDLPELFLRVGAVLPLGPVLQHADEKPLDPLTLVVAPDESGAAIGLLYEDAGDGFGHERGDFALTRFTARRDGGELLLTAERIEGDRPEPSRAGEVVVLTADGPRTATGDPAAGVRVPLS